ncbi:sigma-54-dependent Fis family transcriptional regulator [Marinomonas sp. A79]|uniref:Sigma-54-dependent Fis family transcriptional regulator n=1 Tax=Marinomonas vulgaris TaxID=2823372 RepID=A0ABS5H9B3_9GAMM|nr:sigma-54 dependent transcriptional regulator [Marinomonas vulgaris]MBR7888075.1 sigma-54-dependent Fis family transcriptional regulator [Marinomonas vulgaris]
MNNLTILVIDDEPNLVRSLQFSLNDQTIDLQAAYSGTEGIQRFNTLTPDVVLLDLGLPDMSGLDVLTQLKSISDTPVIMISAHGDTRTAVKAVREGALDYITKPFDIDELELLIRRCGEQQRLSKELHFLRSQQIHTQRIVGNSHQTETLRHMIEQVGDSTAKTILISGPSGTGKALIARSLHDVRFSNAPFIEINCAALPEQLIEAELFGAERGAYTGAVQKRDGLISLADNGTLFLDEIGEMPMAIQAKLLTFLENRVYRSIGGGKEHKANVVVIAATNKNLKTAVDAGDFRADLYYRLNVVPIVAPSLSDRVEDISLLIRFFGEAFAKQEGCKPPIWSEEIIAQLQTYSWPGNIRELKNLVERIIILYPGQTALPKHLPNEYRKNAISTTVDNLDYSSVVEHKERELILSALRKNGGRKGLAAEQLGISRHALKRRIQRLNIDF